MGRVNWRYKKTRNSNRRRNRDIIIIIIGCDFHTSFEHIAPLDMGTGEVIAKRLDHESGEAKRFYEGLKEEALVGIESTGYTQWFAEMLAALGHEMAVGEAGKIRAQDPRKQKHDRRDAAHILNLLVRGDFPKIWLGQAPFEPVAEVG